MFFFLLGKALLVLRGKGDYHHLPPPPPPERAELVMEAVQLREFGFTQQQIAETLGVLRRTVGYWLSNVANGVSSIIANYKANGNNATPNNGNIPITLYAGKMYPLLVLALN